MLYSENALTLDEQVDLLISKGLIANKDELKSRLWSVSYHRLSSYWRIYRGNYSNDLRGSDHDFRWTGCI